MFLLVERIFLKIQKARNMHYEWVEDLYEQCKKHNIAFFFKQWGSNPRNKPEIINLKSSFPKIEEPVD